MTEPRNKKKNQPELGREESSTEISHSPMAFQVPRQSHIFFKKNTDHLVQHRYSDFHFCFTVHRMVGVRKELWRSSSPNLLLKQVFLEYIAQDCTQAGYEYLQKRAAHCSSLSTPKQLFLTFRWNFLCSNFCSLSHILLLDTTKRVWSHLLDLHPVDISKYW